MAQPDGIVKDVVYPVVNEQTLRDLVKEWKASGPAYRQHVQTVIRNSYRSHYRRMVPPPAGRPGLPLQQSRHTSLCSTPWHW